MWPIWSTYYYNHILDNKYNYYIHTYHSRLIPQQQIAAFGIAEASQIFLRDVHVLSKLLSYDVTGGKPIAICSQSISGSGVAAANPLVAFYDIHGRKREVVLFRSIPDIARG
jgi:hypothetical protein